ncbi:sodium-dependent transporter [Marinobacter halodurans]|uniref:Transporter n=1 Tax=Marinobacter halodurans TaxID=2528979 RepID=A0ABY1ZFK3_9GAMM|nr:sodium-dependent transporter [Marinobacter halodurans]TBW46894.1 sodium-dependent transporter [Marinobacter halodurans]
MNNDAVIIEENSKPVDRIWRGKITFVMAAAGSAVGLGNMWKFPYIAGENGGGAFVLVYLACILCFGIPLLMAEIGMGRMGRSNAQNTFRILRRESGSKGPWGVVGALAIVTSYLILSFYIVVAGWCLYYLWITVNGQFNIPGQILDKSVTGGMFDNLLASPQTLIIFSVVFLLITFGIVSSGIKNGIEKTVNWMMPSLMLILVLLIGYSIRNGDFSAAVHFLFNADFHKLTLNAIIVAVGHSFFTLSLASGSMITYGSYMSAKSSVVKTSLAVAGIDTLVALTAGLTIFPLVFEHGLEPGAGPGLVFISLPLLFGDMPYGQLFGTIFFLMLFVAALTSAISLMEPTVAWLEQRFFLSRTRAALLTTLTVWLVSLGTVFSLNIWDNPMFFGKTFFDALDYLTANILMTAGGLATALFCGYCLKEHQLEQMFGGNRAVIVPFRIAMRYVVPLFVVVLAIGPI